jgi:putative Ca2+/H+ antiporter (TMEM165/GDT1 family)
MESILNSFGLVVISEMGDKTQLLALVLAAKFKKPVPILLGIFFATVANHALASFVGDYINDWISPEVLKWILALTFIGFGLWILVPDKDDGLKLKAQWGPFLTTVVAFFFAEMGDKTQLATVALAAKYNDMVSVMIGTTFGMMVADGLAVLFGSRLTERIPMAMINKIASFLFILFGIAIILGF